MQFWLNSLKEIIQKYFATLVVLILVCAFVIRIISLDQPSKYIFDEDFFAFTAQLLRQNDSRVFEWWHGPLENEIGTYTYRAPAIEWLHPPLSKSIQALSISLLGNSSFGWRLPSALAGVGVVWLVIELTQLLFRNKHVSLVAGLITSIEHLMLIQSRIASPDIFLTFFVLMTIWLFWHYHQERNLYRLLTVGVSLGLAVACKWSAIFLLPGLLLFEWLYLSQEKPHRVFIKSTINVLITSLLLVLISSFVYLISYWQLFYQGHSFQYFVELHQQIFHYQTTTTFERPYSSKPRQWLMGEKPIWYFYEQTITKKPTEIIAQPTRWILLLSEIAFCITLWRVVKKKTNKSDSQARWPRLLLLLSIISLFAPWLFVSRPVFIYHFTPIMPLLSIVLADQTNRLLNRSKKPIF